MKAKTSPEATAQVKPKRNSGGPPPGMTVDIIERDRQRMREQFSNRDLANRVKSMVDMLNKSLIASETATSAIKNEPGVRVKYRALVNIKATVAKYVRGGATPKDNGLKINAVFNLSAEQKELLFQISRELELTPQEFIGAHVGFTYKQTLD